MSTSEKTVAPALAESPASGFTAVNVNGKDQTTAVTSINGNPPSRRGSDERSNGQPRITPPGQEKLTITTTTTNQRDDWVTPGSRDGQPYQQPASYSDAEPSQKRKRSGSVEQSSASANSYHSHALPSSTKETPTTATTESDGPRDEVSRGHSHSDSRDSHNPDSQYRHYIAPAEGTTPGGDHWQSRQYPSQSHLNSDEQLVEVLQRESQSMDGHYHHDYDQHSPGDDDRSAYPGYGQDRREMSAQSDPKKRKRNFSNRTKTGCMTCRRRKKKCDETRPECKLCNYVFLLFGGRSYGIRRPD